MQQAAWAAAARMAQEAGPTASTARVPCPSACRSRLAGWPVGIFSALPRAPPRPLLLAFLPAFPPAPGAPIHRLSQRITMPPTAPRPCDPSCCRRRRSLCAIALRGLALWPGAAARPHPARRGGGVWGWGGGGGGGGGWGGVAGGGGAWCRGAGPGPYPARSVEIIVPWAV